MSLDNRQNSPDIEFENQIRFDELAHALLGVFFGLGRTLHMMGQENDAFTRQLDRLQELREKIAQGGLLSIKIINDRFFVNERLCRFAHKSASAQQELDHWRSLSLGGMEITAGASRDDIIEIFKLINGCTPAPDCARTLNEEFHSSRNSSIRLFSDQELEEDSSLSDEMRRQMRRQARTLFFQSIRTVRDCASQFSGSREFNANGTRRVVNSLVDQIITQDETLLELTAIKDYDDYTFAHSVNVCIYSLVIGAALGLDQKRLGQLGFAALFHDIGKVRLPSEVVKKADVFDADDWRYMRRHPILGARMILKNFALDQHAIRAALVAFEHHINADQTGYPQRDEKRDINLFSRIVTVADTYDALTSGRIYIKERVQPSEVLRRMLYQMNNKFDPVILKIFINQIGFFPPGSLALLNDNRVAIIERPADGTNPPLVRIIGDENSLHAQQELLDLADEENRGIEIMRWLNPEEFEVDIKRYILQADDVSTESSI